MNVPEPTTAKLLDKKTAAYEKQQAEVEEESRMKSLEQLAGTLLDGGKITPDANEKDGDRLQQSVKTYEQISSQLDDFYETPEKTVNSDLERKVEELNKKLEEAEKEKDRTASREELMERSYKMAARYLNPDKDTIKEETTGKELPEFRYSGRSTRPPPAFHSRLRIQPLSLRSPLKGITVSIQP